MNVSFFVQKLPEHLAAEISKHMRAVLPAEESFADRPLQMILQSREGLEGSLSSLRETEIKTLELIVKTFASEPFDVSKLEKSGRARMSGAALKVGLIRLCRKGIVFALRKAWGEQLYMLPEDTLGTWLNLLFPAAEGVSSYRVDDREMPITTVSPVQPLLCARVLTLLSYCSREGLPLTQKGTIVKRHITKLNALLRIADQQEKPEVIRYVGEDAYPFTLAALLDICLRLNLLETMPIQDAYKLNEETLGEWLILSEAQMNQTLYAGLAALLIPSDPFIRIWVTCSENIPPGRWFSVPDLMKGLENRQLIDHGALGQERIIKEWLEPLASLGFIELGRSPEGDWQAKWTAPTANSDTHNEDAKDGLKNEPLFVQPDFEIIVPPGTPYSARWELEKFAELEQAGAVSRYRLKRELVLQALDAGYDGERIVIFLKAHAKYGLPETVEYTLLQWANQYGKAVVVGADLFRRRDEETAREMEANPKLQPYFLERIGPLIWRVEPSSLNILYRELEQCGYCPGKLAPKSDGENAIQEIGVSSTARKKQTLANKGSRQAERQKAEEVAQGLIYSRVSVQYYDMERTIPQTEDLYPGLTEVPNMWLKECRTYHAATRMDMIRKAMEWKASVRLRQNGQDRLLVPERVDGTADQWVVSGYNLHGEVKLSPEQWEEMQLVLPGINDEG